MTNRSLLTRILLAVVFSFALASPGRAIFGMGKSAEKKSAADTPAGELPGMGASSSGPSDSEEPSMAQAMKGDAQAAAAAPATNSAEAPAETPASENETSVGGHPSPDGSLPTEVVIKGGGTGKVKVTKPPLHLTVDNFESIRESIKPDQQLLLAESPLTVVWRRTHPEFMKVGRVIEPWRTTFSERPGIVFSPRDQLTQALQRKLDEKEAKSYQWSLTIADEEGKVFQHYEGSSLPPAEIVWSGQNDQGEWITAGRAYSPVYMFTDPGGTPYTRVGNPLRFKGVIHQERDGLHITLDSAELWSKAKSLDKPTKGEGESLLRAAADLIKRRYTGLPIRVEAYAGSKELAERQSRSVQEYLLSELMLLPQDVTTDSTRTPYAEQRTEILLLNR